MRQDELIGMRVLKVGLSKAQWLKILYTKAYVLSHFGGIQDSIQADYQGHRDEILTKYRDVIDPKHLERFEQHDPTKGFWGNFTHYAAMPPGNVKADELISLGDHVLFLLPSWYQRNPGLLAFMNLPTASGLKIIDIDIHNTIGDLYRGNPILGPEFTHAYAKYYNMLVECNLKDRLMGFGDMGEFYQVVRMCSERIREYLHEPKAPMMWSGGGFQILADWERHKQHRTITKKEDGDEKIIDYVDPVNTVPKQFMRLLSPMLYKAHLTTSMPIDRFEDFRMANPAFYPLPLSSLGNNGKSALSKFEFSFKSDTMNRILEKSGLKDRYLARRAYQLHLAGQMGIGVEIGVNPYLIESYEKLEGVSWQ